MRIVRISTRIYPDYGGPAKQAYLLSKYCAENDIRITNIACIPKNKVYLKREKIDKNFDIIYLPFHAPGVNSRLITLLTFFIKFFVYTFKEVIKIIRKEKVHLIHAHTPLPSGFIAYSIYKLFKIPYFYTIHGLDIPTPFLLNFDFKLSAKNSIKTFTVSQKLKNYILKYYPLSNVLQLPNGIESSQFHHINSLAQKGKILQNLDISSFIKNEDRIIIYIGYMILPQKVKGMTDFLLGFKAFLQSLNSDEKRENFKLLYIGDGDFSTRLQKQITELKLSKQVFLLGKRDDINDLLSISDLLALTSYVEGFPNVLLEAMASYVPCLGTNVGDIRNIIGNTGYIVEPGDIGAMSSSLQNYFNLSKPEQEKLGQSANNRVYKLFDISTIGKILIDFYNLK